MADVSINFKLSDKDLEGKTEREAVKAKLQEILKDEDIMDYASVDDED